MFVNRVLFGIVVVVLLVVGALTVRSAFVASALATTPTTADRSYDDIEHLRANRDGGRAVDHSYDEIEHLRATRGEVGDIRYLGWIFVCAAPGDDAVPSCK